MQGVVKNTSAGKYMERGNMFNFENVMHRRKQPENLIAFSTRVVTMCFRAEIFLKLVEQFPDIKEDI